MSPSEASGKLAAAVAMSPSWNPRYVAYSAVHNRTPEEQGKFDSFVGYGGASFTFWIREAWRRWDKLHGKSREAGSDATHHSTADHQCFDHWLIEHGADLSCEDAKCHEGVTILPTVGTELDATGATP